MQEASAHEIDTALGFIGLNVMLCLITFRMAL